MTTFTFKTAAFLNAISHANNYSSTGEDYKGLISIKGNDGLATIEAANYEEYVCFKNIKFTSSDLTNNSFNVLSIDGKKLLTVLKNAKGEEFSLLVDDKIDHIVVKSGRSKIKIDRTNQVQEFIRPVFKNKELNLNNELISSFKKVLHSINPSLPQIALRGVHLDCKNSVLNVVATDTRRLSLITLETKEKDFEVIIPKSAIVSMTKLFSFSENTAAAVSETDIQISGESIVYSSKLINDKYAAYRSIVCSDFAKSLVLNKSFFKMLIKEVSLFEDQITIDINNGIIKLNDMPEDEKESSFTEDEIDDKEIELNFSVSAKALLDVIDNAEDDEIELNFNDKAKPIVFKMDINYQEIVMPIIVN